MKKRILTFLFAVLPLFTFAATGTPIPGGSQNTTFLINKPGAYYLAADRLMANKGQIAIRIEASDVTLDLNNYTLKYPDSEGPFMPAIKVYGSNIEIRNGSITTVPGFAIHVDAIAQNVGLRVFDIRISDTRGIWAGAAATLIERCHVIDTVGNGIQTSTSSTVRDCVVQNVLPGDGQTTGMGIVVGSAVITGCTVEKTAATGIYCGSKSIIKNNLVSYANQSASPTAAGIHLFSQHTNASENSVVHCFAAGIRISGSSAGNVLERNVISETQPGGPQIGFAIVSGTASTLVRGNLGHGNAAGFISGNFIDGGSNLVF